MPDSPVADLILGLTEPSIHDADGVRRAAARASLVYEPPAGSRERRLAGPRFDLVAPIGSIEKHEIDWLSHLGYGEASSPKATARCPVRGTWCSRTGSG